jgi:hypothetical protein
MRSMVPELNGGEGAALTSQGGPLGQGGALQPATQEGGMVSRAIHGGRGHRKQGRRRSAYRSEHGQHARWRAPFIAVHRVRLMRSCGGDGMGRMTHHIVQRQLGSCVEGTRGVFCLYVIGEVSWKGRGEAMRPHGAHGHANAHYLGVRKGRLRLGLNSVHRHTRREEAAALPKTCLPAHCPWHRGGSQRCNGSAEAQRWR